MYNNWRAVSRLTTFSRSFIFSSWTALQSNNATNPENKDTTEPGIPLVPKTRDPHAVLKALASTVSPLKDPFVMERSLADPLAPRNRRQMLEFLMAKEAGYKAAMHVIHHYPKLFPAYQPVPDLRPKAIRMKGCNEETLKCLIELRRTGRAMKMYRTLKDKGEKISLEVENGLLSLLCFYGLGNPWANKPTRSMKKSSANEETSLETDLEDSDILAEHEELADAAGDNKSDSTTDNSIEEDIKQDEVEARVNSLKIRKVSPEPHRVWSLENNAERFFAEMTQKDGGTYGVLIQGLVKFKEYNRAFALFTEARDKGHQLNLLTYNCLLQVLTDLQEPKLWKKAKDIIVEMTKSPIVQPDITTINLLLQIARSTGTSSQQLALETIREMNYLGLEPTLTTFLRLLQAFMLHVDGSVLYEITDYIEKNPDILTVKDPLDIYFFSTAMSCARLLRDHDLAIRLKTLAMKDNWYLVDSLSFFLNHYLATVTTSSDISLLKREYNELVPSIYVPKEWLYTLIFKQCEVTDAPDVALELWNSLLKLRVLTQDPVLFNRLMGAFNRPIDPMCYNDYIKAVRDVWRKLEYLQIPPTPLIISTTIKLLTLNGELDEAWEYYKMFMKYKYKPTFLSLTSLLKAHYGYGDTTKVSEILDLMIQNGYFLPLTFVRDICWKLGIPISNRSKYMEGFQRNEPAKSDNKSKEDFQKMAQLFGGWEKEDSSPKQNPKTHTGVSKTETHTISTTLSDCGTD